MIIIKTIVKKSKIMKCLVTKLKASVNNSNLPVFSEGTFSLNKATAGTTFYNIVDEANKCLFVPKEGKSITYKIASGNAHFVDSGGNNVQTITVAKGDVFGVCVDSGNTVDPVVKYSRMCDIEEFYQANNTRIALFTKVEFLKILPYLKVCNVGSTSADHLSEAISWDDFEGISTKMGDWRGVISGSRVVHGDLACIPKIVKRIAASTLANLRYTVNKRSGHDCNPLMIGRSDYGANGIFTTEELNNYFIATAGCLSPSASRGADLTPPDGALDITYGDGAIGKSIHVGHGTNVGTTEEYVPSDAAKAAINTILSWGFTVKVNGTALSAYPVNTSTGTE